MRRNGEVEARRLARAPTRLCFGEPRVWLMGVDLAVLGEERVLRLEGTGVAAGDLAGGGVARANLDGFWKAPTVFGFLLGEVAQSAGSTFSASTSSWNMSGARWRLPVAGVEVGFNGEEKVGEDMAAAGFSRGSCSNAGRRFSPFCLFFALCRACSRGAPRSANGWRA